MSGFIGMPMWNYKNPSLAEIREYDRRILAQQALGFKPMRESLLKRSVVGLKSIAITAFGQIAKAGKKTSEIKQEITKPVNTGTECCG